jgi:hypothetical protein
MKMSESVGDAATAGRGEAMSIVAVAAATINNIAVRFTRFTVVPR